MTEVDEAALVARCQAGDEGAFRELVDRYKDLVYAIIARTVPDRMLADDLAQEVFLRVHRGLRYFRGDARLSTWIYTITANVCIQERGRPKPLVVALDEGRDRPAAQIGAPDGAFDEIELRDRLEKAIAKLPGHYPLLIAACYLKGLQYEELAAALRLPLGTVKTQLHRAKRRLRELLEEQAAAPGEGRERGEK